MLLLLKLSSKLVRFYFLFVIKMPKKCCVTGCRVNHDSQKGNIHAFRLPSNAVDRQAWIEGVVKRVLGRENRK